MIKAIAIPARLNRPDLSEAELAELNSLFGLQPMSQEEVQARQVELGEAESLRRSKLPDFLAKLRRDTVDYGFSFKGKRFYADNASISALTAARIIASGSSTYSVNWKTADGFISLSGAEVIEVSNVALAFVQKCFNAESKVLEKIKNGEIILEDKITTAFNSELSLEVSPVS